jgi:hypothetical protein
MIFAIFEMPPRRCRQMLFGFHAITPPFSPMPLRCRLLMHAIIDAAIDTFHAAIIYTPLSLFR